ncbi:hypothetical protein HMPREF3213_02276 [Heyndrickxia coagulans]|uniref:Uncharacterized protein n=1 Tax=Heyndrickxia coagulans TaxID=1398 RepID=A0A133KLX2_HEYCO|nr:hypothetical protein HMPREF3213_02276 [Heyndrickxia coagulans]
MNKLAYRSHHNRILIARTVCPGAGRPGKGFTMQTHIRPFKLAPVFPLAGGCTNDALPTAIL